MLMYYFDDPYKELFESRIICVDGDITSKEQVTGFSEYKFSTIINCAACVKHFLRLMMYWKELMCRVWKI